MYAGVLLDAPFDDLVPLAERIVPSLLPQYFVPFTEVVLRRHFNLDVATQLSGTFSGTLVHASLYGSDVWLAGFDGRISAVLSFDGRICAVLT